MKYRILEKKMNNSSLTFKPQYKFWGIIWREWSHHYNPSGYNAPTFDTIAEAQAFLDKRAEIRARKFSKVIHTYKQPTQLQRELDTYHE